MLLLLLLILSTPSLAEPIEPSDIRVIDGDTIRVYHQQPNVRLVGFNAPEIRRAECGPELELGAKATRRLRSLVRDGIFNLNMCDALALQEPKGHPHVITDGIVERSCRMAETSEKF